MSLCKSRTLTPARVAANRANVVKSTGPRTPRAGAAGCTQNIRHLISCLQRVWLPFFSKLLPDCAGAHLGIRGWSFG